jgi:MFS family permease
MQKAISPPAGVRPVWLTILAAGCIVGTAMGLRQIMGLFMTPMTTELAIGREPFSLAMAIANLIWGIASVPMGLVADKYGTARVVIVGALATMAGLVLMWAATTGTMLLLSGVLLGIGIGGTGVSALVGAVGRAVPAEKRPQALASLGMAAGIGGFVAFPYAHVFMELIGWKATLLVAAATIGLVIPLGFVFRSGASTAGEGFQQSFGEAFREALAHPSFWLLMLGFFVCGFHVAFYAVHLPAFVADRGLPSWVAVAALTSVGVANIIGTYLAGQSAKFAEKRVGLAFIYFMRCFAFLALLYVPITAETIIAISVMLGFFWLSTVPLTSAMIATFFGPQWMSMLFGLVFLSHQVGSFTGLWLAGRLYDMTRSYDMMWWISIALGLFAALVHLPIREKPVERAMAAQPATA